MAGLDTVGTSSEILRLMDEACHADRQVVIYPNLDGFRRIYSEYTKKHLERDNEIVVLLPYYETIEGVMAVLRRNGVDVEKYGRRGELIIRDAYRTYSGFREDRELLFKRILAHAAATGKSVLSIILDMGTFNLIADVHSMATGYQDILPREGSTTIRGFLSYHRSDYDKLSHEHMAIRFAEDYKTLLVFE